MSINIPADTSAKEAARILVAELHKIKAPHEAARQKLWDELSIALDGPQAKEREIRESIKAMHAVIRPIDEALSTANAVKLIKSPDIRATVVDRLVGIVEKIRSE